MRREVVQQIGEQFPATIEEDSNTIKEDLTLEYVDQFQQQYSHLFPQRPSLLLSPKNEHQIHVCILYFISICGLNNFSKRNLFVRIFDQPSCPFMSCIN